MTPRLFAVCLLLAALAGCSSDKAANPIPPGPKYAPSSTPQNTLANMAKAYSTRDSTGYDSLFDSTYVGTSFDPVSMAALHFTKADEKLHIAKLAKTQTITSVIFEYPPNLVRERDNADPAGVATIHLQAVLIAVAGEPDVVTVTPSLVQEFKFAPTTPSMGSPTDTTWHIVSWTEIAGP